jgi:copper transport protein
VYTVQWRSLSAIDVHPDAGEYPLFVGVPVKAPVQANAAALAGAVTATPETTFGRWWFYVAASLFGGVLAGYKLVLSPALGGQVHAAVRRRARRLIVVGGILLIIGTLFTALAQAAAAANVPISDALGKPVADLLLRGRFASIWWPRLGLEVASLALIALGGVDGLASECALATLPAVLLTSALTSHGAALPAGSGPGIAIDWLHIVGATAWVGGLIALLASLAAVRAASDSSLLMVRLVGRFGRFALLASMAVLLSGIVQAAFEVGRWSALLGTTYGELVVAKTCLLLLMLALAGYNEWQTRRAPVTAWGLRVGVRLELIAGVIVLGVAAILSGTPPSATG